MDGAVFRSHKKLDLVTLAVTDRSDPSHDIRIWKTKPAKINQPLVTPSKFYSDNLSYSNKPSAQSVAAGPVLRAVLAAPATGLALPAAAATVLPAAAALLALFAGLHGEEGLLAQLLL